MMHLKILTTLALFALTAAACQPAGQPPAVTPTVTPALPTEAPTATPTTVAPTAAPTPTEPPKPTETPAPVPAVESDPALEAFANDLRTAIDSADMQALQNAMGPRFNIIWWMGDGMEYDPDEAAAVLRDEYLTSAEKVEVVPEADLARLLGNRPIAFFAPNTKAERAWFVTGLGLDGKGEGLAFVARQPDGTFFWNGLMFAPAGFDDAGMATYLKWNTYTSEVYGFGLQYPEGWQVVEVPNEIYQSGVDQVWLAAGELPPPNTGASPDVVVTITEDDPSPQWDAQYFDDYSAEPTMLGVYPGTRIKGVNKESQTPMEVVIAKAGDVYLQVLPNLNPEPAWQYEIILTTFAPALR